MCATPARPTATSFADKDHYEIDVDHEFAALGAANIPAAPSQAFAISGVDSRTVMNDSTVCGSSTAVP